jgi:hypothetical protein
VSKITAWDDSYFEVFKKSGFGKNLDLQDKIFQKYLKKKMPSTKSAVKDFILKELSNYEK